MSININLHASSSRTTELLGHPEQFKELIPIPAIRAFGVGRSIYWRTFHPLTFGAAVAVTDLETQRIALIRQTYGDSDMWKLPGGGLDKHDWTTAYNATKSGIRSLNSAIFEPSARREVREEIGVEVGENDLTHLFNYESNKDSKGRYANRDTLGIFHLDVDLDQIDLKPQRTEIAEVRIWDIGELPYHRASYLGRLALDLQQLKQVAA